MNSTAPCPSSDVHALSLSATIDAANRQTDISNWVSQACSLSDEIKEREEALARVKAHLVELPPGVYKSATGRRVTVVGSSTAIKPGEPQVAAARVVAGSLAPRLFTRQVVFKPVAGLRDIARALLSPKRAAKLIALCEVSTSAQVRI